LPPAVAARANECETLDISILPEPKITKFLNRRDLLGLLAALRARDAAHLSQAKSPPLRRGIFCSVGSTHIADLSPYFYVVLDCVDRDNNLFDSSKFGHEISSRINPIAAIHVLQNNGIATISQQFDLQGPHANYFDGPHAGLRAVWDAVRAIESEQIDWGLAGGFCSPIDPFQLAANKGGAVQAEAAAFLAIESKAFAKARGAEVLAEVAGYGEASIDDQTCLERAARKALNSASVTLDGIDLIVRSASGQKSEDAAEFVNISQLLAGRAVPIRSPNLVLGDSGEAGGILQTIAAISNSKALASRPACAMILSRTANYGASALIIRGV